MAVKNKPVQTVGFALRPYRNNKGVSPVGNDKVFKPKKK